MGHKMLARKVEKRTEKLKRADHYSGRKPDRFVIHVTGTDGTDTADECPTLFSATDTADEM